MSAGIEGFIDLYSNLKEGVGRTFTVYYRGVEIQTYSLTLKEEAVNFARLKLQHLAYDKYIFEHPGEYISKESIVVEVNSSSN